MRKDDLIEVDWLRDGKCEMKIIHWSPEQTRRALG